MSRDFPVGFMANPSEFNKEAVERYKAQDFEGAEALYREALKIDPAYFPSQLNLGILMFKMGRYDDAIKECTRAVSLRSDNPSAHFHLGNAYYAKMWWEEALVEYERVYTLDPSHVDVHFALGGIYLNRGYKDKAVECWKKYLESAPPESMKAKLATEYVQGTTANQVHIGKYIAE